MRGDYLEDIRRNLRDSLNFWSNRNKPERERAVVRAFFRCLGVSFAESDLLVGQPEPIDVGALSSRFQITEVLAGGRERHKEYRERLRQAGVARSATDLRERWSNPTPIARLELIELIAARLRAKTAHKDIDALVYVNLRGRFLAPTVELESVPDIAELGWRSVSIVSIPYALVLHAETGAPDYLKRVVGTPQMKWSRVDGWFESGA